MESNREGIPTNTCATSIVNLFANEINQEDIQELLHVQQEILEQLDKTNARLDGLNRVSAQRYLDATKQFEKHTQFLSTMKTDLDTIFKRIKFLKNQLNLKYPDAYVSAVQMNSCDDDDEEENDTFNTPLKPFPNSSLVKSKTVDGSQLSSSMRETFSLAQIPSEPSPRSFDTMRRFVLENSSSAGQDLSSLLKNARDELRKLNQGFLGGNPSKKE